MGANASDTLQGKTSGSGPKRTDHKPVYYTTNGDPIFDDGRGNQSTTSYALTGTLHLNNQNRPDGTLLSWTFPVTLTGLINASETTLLNARLFLQRSTNATNTPLFPLYQGNIGSGPLGTPIDGNPPVDANWTTIAQWLAGTAFPLSYLDSTLPNPTFNYRLLLFINTAGEGLEILSEIDWNPVTNSVNAPGSILNAVKFGDTSVDYAIAIAADNLGNTFIGRDFTSAAINGLIQKLDSHGVVVWSVGLPLTGTQRQSNVRAICLDATGNVYVTGSFRGTLTLDGHSVASPTAGNDVYVLKLQDNGTSATCQWIVSGHADSAATADPNHQSGLGIVAYDTWIAVIGLFTQPSISFGTTLSTTGGGCDAFFVKLKQSDGSELWSHQLGLNSGYTLGLASGAPKAGVAVSLTVNPGELAFGGTAFGTANFGNGHSETSSWAWPFIVRYDTSNSYVSHRFIHLTGTGLTDQTGGRSACVDSSGNMYLVGSWAATADFGAGGTLPNSTTDNIFIACYARDGSHVWHSICNVAGPLESAYGICFDPTSNRVSITGTVQNSPTFISPNATRLITSGFNAFIATWDALGNYQWGETFLPTDTAGAAIAVSQTGLYAIGSFFTSITLGTYQFTSSGNYDVWVAQVNK